MIEQPIANMTQTRRTTIIQSWTFFSKGADLFFLNVGFLATDTSEEFGETVEEPVTELDTDSAVFNFLALRVDGKKGLDFAATIFCLRTGALVVVLNAIVVVSSSNSATLLVTSSKSVLFCAKTTLESTANPKRVAIKVEKFIVKKLLQKETQFNKIKIK